MQPARRTIATAQNFTIGIVELVSDASDKPLLVCLPGGSYTAEYFDVAEHSLLRRAAAHGFDVVALDRPNYGASDALAPDATTFARNAEIIDDAIAQLWAQRGCPYPGVVLIGHSIGGAVAIHLAAQRSRDWPLLGISISGISELSPAPVVDAWRAIPPGAPVDFTNEQRRAYMYGPDGSFAPEVIEHAAIAAAPIPLAELHEIIGGWLEDIPHLGPRVAVPVQYALPEFDQLWVVSPERVEAFANRFANAPLVDAILARGVGHNLDHHADSDTWHARQLAFAQECVLAAATSHTTSTP
jgi:pimeloyl-ACP methyl ester carboxylesterase